MSHPEPITPPSVTLMGPGPSDVPPSVLGALSSPTLGHLDPRFLAIMDEVIVMLRQVYGTTHQTTIPISATGSAGMEAVLVNLLEPGDRFLVGVNGVFGGRMAEVARRCGAEVVTVDRPWGEAFTPEDLRTAASGRAFKGMALVHAETSTGVLQDLTGMRAVADELGALLIIDAVTSLGGLAVDLDRWGVDAAYSGTQKCLSCPPGLSPVSLSDRAMTAVQDRREPSQSWYLDLTLLTRYWGGERAYHHTAPVHMIYALHESLRLVVVEGLEAREARHRAHSRALAAGLEALGLEPAIPEAIRLPPLTLVRTPAGVDEAAVRKRLLMVHGIEIGGGLGAFKGQAWRIGLMGASATQAHVTGCLSALATCLEAEGWAVPGEPVAAALATYERD